MDNLMRFYQRTLNHTMKEHNHCEGGSLAVKTIISLYLHFSIS